MPVESDKAGAVADELTALLWPYVDAPPFGSDGWVRSASVDARAG